MDLLSLLIMIPDTSFFEGGPGDWRRTLDQIVETMREMSLQDDPQAMVRSYGARMRRFQPTDGFVSPLQRYPELKRGDWHAHWKRSGVIVEADDGTWGFGMTNHAGPVNEIVNGHFSHLLAGQDCMATERLWDRMRRASAPYGTQGLARYAISAVDNALWDLKGKVLGRPVYELLGGPQKESIPCYASNTDLSYGTEESVTWFLELGFEAVKVFLREGPEAGIAGIRRSEELVARTREQIGPDVELMVDAWISLDVETTVRLGEALRPYRIKWLEDYLLPEDIEGYARVRERLPGTTLASGEHWYGPHPFAAAAGRGLVDILQPDLAWCGGISAGVRICHLAEAHGGAERLLLDQETVGGGGACGAMTRLQPATSARSNRADAVTNRNRCN